MNSVSNGFAVQRGHKAAQRGFRETLCGLRTCAASSSCWALLAVLLLAALVPAQKCAQKPRAPPRTEVLLAGLQPGRDHLARAIQLYGAQYAAAYANTPDLLVWADSRKHIYLKLELTPDKTISAVTVASYGPDAAPPVSLPAAAAASGSGLRLGDPMDKALQIYGKPYFQGPSSEGGRELLLVVHKFNVPEALPQVLETSYAPQTRKLVKIMLSFPYY